MWGDPAIATLFTWPVLALVALGAFLGALASASSGFAFGLVAASVWLHVLDPIRTGLLIVASSLLLQLSTVWQLRAHIDGRRLAPFLIGGLIGIPIGVRLLLYTTPDHLKAGLGTFLVAFGAYALVAPRLPEIKWGGRIADAVVGLAGGILGGLGGYSGVLPTIWTQLRGWPKETARGVYQPFIIVAQLVSLVLIGFLGLDIATVLLFGAILPLLAAGALVGWNLYGRLDDRRFRQLLAALLVASGLTLVI